jgi:chromosome segregation ATPase
MNRRAESDSKARKLLETIQTYEARLEAFDKIEDDLEATRANLVTVVSEKSKLELEIAKLREVRDECERKEAVLSNRLNEAKKKEANKSNTAGRLELDNEELRASLEKAKSELETVSKAKAKLESNMEKLKTKAVERVKQAETALKEERELNEERKKKMKVFVETKAEELREAKENAGDMQKELHETRASLSASREREESFQKELENSRIKYREVQRDMERMKRNAEALHNMGNNLEQELEKSASETEEHKKKRISAKHELMTMMRTLEVERGVSEKLRESMKFTFAPKAQSQQQLLSECLRDFEQELDRLSMKLGKSLMPQSQTSVSEPPKSEEVLERSESNGGSEKKARKGRASKADLDTERLIYHLEQETQHVSKGIMALVNSIERMRILLDEDSTFNCMAFFHHLGLAIGTGEARHQRLGGEAHDDRDEHVSITSFEQR